MDAYRVLKGGSEVDCNRSVKYEVALGQSSFVVF